MNLPYTKQPKGIIVIFFAELSQRFSYWGLQSLLVLFLIHNLLLSKGNAYTIYGAFTGLTFATAILGGVLADRLFGFKRSVIIGIIFSLIGNITLVLSSNQPSIVLIGLAFICYGTGTFLPCNSNLLGTFYQEDDTRRARGFTILYIGTNIGGLSAPIVYGFIYHYVGWMLAFIISSVGFILWFILYFFMKKYLAMTKNNNLEEGGRQGFSKSIILFMLSIIFVFFIYLLLYFTSIIKYIIGVTGTIVIITFLIFAFKNKIHRGNLLTLLLMILITLIFFTFELQTNSSFIIFAKNFVHREYFGLVIPPSTIAALEPGFVIISSAFLIWIWQRLGKFEPRELLKMYLGLLLTAIAFLLLIMVVNDLLMIKQQISLGWLIIVSFLLGTAEACIMPSLLAAITRLAPPKLKGTIMGALYLAIAFSGYFSGLLAKMTTTYQSVKGELDVNSSHIALLGYQNVFSFIFYSLITVIVLLTVGLILQNLIKKRAKSFIKFS